MKRIYLVENLISQQKIVRITELQTHHWSARKGMQMQLCNKKIPDSFAICYKFPSTTKLVFLVANVLFVQRRSSREMECCYLNELGNCLLPMEIGSEPGRCLGVWRIRITLVYGHTRAADTFIATCISISGRFRLENAIWSWHTEACPPKC